MVGPRDPRVNEAIALPDRLTSDDGRVFHIRSWKPVVEINQTESVTVDGVTTAIGKAVQCRISSGTADADHVLTCTFATDGSNQKVTGGTLQVRDS